MATAYFSHDLLNKQGDGGCPLRLSTHTKKRRPAKLPHLAPFIFEYSGAAEKIGLFATAWNKNGIKDVTPALPLLRWSAISIPCNLKQTSKLDKMTHEHNPSEDTHRCKWCGASLLKSDGELVMYKEAVPSARADAHSSHGELASPREKALLIREEAIEERENDLRRREELFALQQGRSFALRVQEISDAQIAKVEQEYRHSKLKEANEYLVIESQIRDEVNRKDQCRDDSCNLL